MEEIDVDKLSDEELKNQLEEKGLPTTGSRPVQRERLRMAIQRDQALGDDNEEVDFNSLTVKELRFRLRRLGLGFDGEKDVLLARLKDALQDVDNGDGDNDGGGGNGNNGGGNNGEQVGAVGNQPGARYTRAVLTFKDVEEALDPFDGKTGQSVKRWVSQFEDTATMCEWTPVQRLLYAKRLMRGSAKSFVSYEGCDMSWVVLKRALLREFSAQLNSHEVHQKLQSRRKKNDETYQEYVYKMLEIAAEGDVEECAVIRYVIDGLEGDNVSKSVLYGATNVREFKKKLEVFEKIVRKPKSNQPTNTQAKEKGAAATGAIKKEYVKKNVDEINCFSCGIRGHYRGDCPDKGKGIKCFNCNGYGHKAAACKETPKVKKESNVGAVQSGSRKYCKEVLIGDVRLNALVDTGSDLTLMRADCFADIGMPRFEKKVTSFCGIGSGEMSTLGRTTVKMLVDDDEFEVKPHIVSQGVMNYQLLIGTDFLNTVDVLLKAGEPFISKPKNEFTTNEVLQIDVVHEVNEVSLSHVSEDDVRCQVEELIENYRPNKIREVDMKVRILLKDDLPVYQSARRLGFAERKIVNEQIVEWEKDGIVRPSNSDYASPIVLVKKKDGSTRICVDYRKLNEKIIKNRFPMPIIDDQLDKLHGAKVFSTLDLKNGFFHVAIEESDVKFTAFIVPDGTWEFLRLPFGMCISPAYFQKYILIIFRQLIAEGVLQVFMDDLIIPAKDVNEGLERLKRVLSVASEYGLKFNWKKCSFLQRRVSFLGYVIEDGTVKPSDEKTEAVRQFPLPTTVQKVMSFLGLTGFFRKFIENYSVIARPLTNLTKKDVRFRVGVTERDAFDRLKDALCSEPVLRLYNPAADTELHTDASALGLGAILLQRDSEDRQFHPIHYASWKTKPEEERYDSYKLEVLAVVKALKKFRMYLVGISFKIVTDCQAFTMTMKKKDISSQIARWALCLEEFDYSIEHRPGERMKHVDALSRCYTHEVCLVDDGVTASWRRNQEDDEEIAELKEKVRGGTLEGYTVDRNLLYKTVGDESLLVVPKAMQTGLIRRTHEMGHFGVAKTEQLLKREYWFCDMRGKVEKVLRNCTECILAERKSGKLEGFLQSIDKGESPIDTYHIDHIGPLPSTKKMYNHVLVVVDAFTKFVWLYPTKTTKTAEVVEKLMEQAAIFGNPRRIISDRGTAFTSAEFANYCKDEGIEHSLIVTGVPRGNGQVERVNRTLIPILAKLSVDNPGEWHRYVDRAQQYLNHIPSRAIGMAPFTLLFGTRMRLKDDPEITEIIEQENSFYYTEKREEMRERAREAIAKIQRENKSAYNRKRKEASGYKEGDLVAIQRTQGGPGLKLRSKFLGPYKVTRVMRNDRYLVQKVGEHEGPKATSTAADHMKMWTTMTETEPSDT